MRIAVHEAEVKTASVEIRTLTISGKQVTLAVFRQLVEEPLFWPREGILHGLPWGRVNYHPEPKRCPEQRHEHVVWQKGDELRRSTVTYPGLPFHDVFDWLGQDSAKALVAYALLNGNDVYGDFSRHDPGWYTAHAAIPDIEGDVPLRVLLTYEEAVRFDELQKHNLDLCATQYRVDGEVMHPTHFSADRICRRLLGDYESTIEDAQREVPNWRVAMDRLRDRWWEIQDLPQLFIAV